jgi:hypothetical protein
MIWNGAWGRIERYFVRRESVQECDRESKTLEIGPFLYFACFFNAVSIYFGLIGCRKVAIESSLDSVQFF